MRWTALLSASAAAVLAVRAGGTSQTGSDALSDHSAPAVETLLLSEERPRSVPGPHSWAPQPQPRTQALLPVSALFGRAPTPPPHLQPRSAASQQLPQFIYHQSPAVVASWEEGGASPATPTGTAKPNSGFPTLLPPLPSPQPPAPPPATAASLLVCDADENEAEKQGEPINSYKSWRTPDIISHTWSIVPWAEIGVALALVLGLAPIIIVVVILGSLKHNDRRLKQPKTRTPEWEGDDAPVIDPNAWIAIEPEMGLEDAPAVKKQSSRVDIKREGSHHEVQLVSSPYSGQRESQPQLTDPVLQLLRLFRICVPTPFCWQACYLVNALVLAFVDGVLECLVPILIVKPLWKMVRDDALQQFREFAVFMMFYNGLISIVKATANYNSMLAMVQCRHALVNHLNKLYLSCHGRPYYTLSNLDSRVDAPDARITNDTDLLFQFLFEFVFGGILKPEAGMCSQVFFLVATLGLAYSETEVKAPGWGVQAIGISLSVVVVSLVPTLIAARQLTESQADVQAAEARLRAAHTKCRLFAESVCFYAGEASEAQQLDERFHEVRIAFKSFAFHKLFVDLIQLSFYFGLCPIALVIAAFIVRQGDWTQESQNTFYVLYLTFVRIIRCCMEISKNIVDLAKAKAMLRRVIHLLEVMEAFVAFDERTADAASPEQSRPITITSFLVSEEERLCCLRYYMVRALHSGEVIPAQASSGIVFENVDVYTPDGLRLLLGDVSLSLSAGESCLVMGPSGIGKSSLLRVLGQLWPLFRSPGQAGLKARWCRPGPRNLFFLAQRPYLFEGTLREQLAYPLWDDEEASLLTQLSDERMERLFKEANLEDVWEARKDELDANGISWCDVLSLGEQQRLQFCRLFWHAEWHQTHGDNSQGFFAVLDESSASMDTTSEMMVYQACRDRGIGFLSVAHRPTVIQFHHKVLLFEFDEEHILQHCFRDARAMAHESAHLITNEGNNNVEIREKNTRRSSSSRNLLGSMTNLSGLRRGSTTDLQSIERGSSANLKGLERTRSSACFRNQSVMSLSSLVTNAGSTVSLHQEHTGTLTPKHVIDKLREDDPIMSPLNEEQAVLEEPLSEGHPDALVLSPYSDSRESEADLSSTRSLWRLALICQKQGIRLTVIVFLNLLAAILLACWSIVFVNVKSIMRPGKSTEFKALGENFGVCVSFESMLPFVLLLGPAQGIVKALANYLTVLLMIDWRTELHKQLQGMYLSREARLYYTLNCLDMRVDSADQRITNDVDLLMQFLFEFFFGGVMKPDTGVLFKGSTFVVSCCIMWLEVESKSPGKGPLAPGLAVLLFTVTFLLVERLGRYCGEAQQKVQASEGAFRAAHARCQTFAEGISLYGGEATEKVLLDGHFDPVGENFTCFARRKYPMEVLQLLFYQGQFTIAMLLGGVVAFRTDDQGSRTRLFDLINAAMVLCLMALNKITCQAMDLAKATALCLRVSKLYEVMEAFLEYERAKVKGTGKVNMNTTSPAASTIDVSRSKQSAEVEQAVSIVQTVVPQGPCCPYAIKKLPCGELVTLENSESVVFKHVDVYTPDGLRLLLEDVSLSLEKGDRCLIMGPSGIGKSSLLRVLGGLWPVFRTPNSKEARFCRPGPEQVFFLAQRPYLFEGTLRQNVAYPVWEQALLDDLSDDKMEELLRSANLLDAWNAHRHNLDKTGIAWADLLSLGEQQRLQFCRLFWHHEHVKKTRGPKKSFFAVLDESSASMDTKSEACVYKACVDKKIGILSVAHRPTVIQFHTKVLHFEFDNCHVLRHRVRPATIMARETAMLLTKHIRQSSNGSSGTAPSASSEALPSRDAPFRAMSSRLRKWTEQSDLEKMSPREDDKLWKNYEERTPDLPMTPSTGPVGSSLTPVFAPL